MGVYILNPTMIPQYYRNVEIPAANYSVVSQELAEEMRKAELNIIIEKDENYKDIWNRYNTGETPKDKVITNNV